MSRARELAGALGLTGVGVIIGTALRWAPEPLYVPVVLAAGLAAALGGIAYVTGAPS